MKKTVIIFLSLILLTGILSSCKKEPTYDTPRRPMVPETKTETEAPEESKDLTSTVKGSFINSELGMSITFDGNGSCTMYDDSVPFEGSYSYDGDIIVITDAEGNETSALFTDGNKSLYISGIDTPFLLDSENSTESDIPDSSITVDIPVNTTEDKEEENTDQEVPSVDLSAFYGCWQYENENSWIIINNDGSYIYFMLADDLATFEQSGPYSFECKEDSIYLPEYELYLYPDEGELSDSEGNPLYRDEIFDPIA